MAKTTVQQMEKMQRARESALSWYNIQASDHTMTFIFEQLALHRDLPVLIAAIEYQMNEMRGIIEEGEEGFK